LKDIKEKVIRGGFARLCVQAASFAVRIVSMMLLARLLDPKDFGLVAMVTALTSVLDLFRDFGLSSAAIHNKNVTEEQSSTLFWINMLVGLVLSLMLMALAPLIVGIYHQPQLFWVTIVLSTGFVINAAGIQHSVLLERQMRFTALAWLNILCLVISTTVGISMAFRGYGYWSLVGMTVSSPIVSTTALWLTTRWIPGTPKRNVGMRSMMRFGGTVTLNGLVVYVAYNLEKVLLGRFWGPEAVGIYGRAYQLINVPTENLNSAVGGVAFRALCEVRDEPGRFKTYFLKGYSLVLGLTVPATITSALFANDLILVMLGPKWKDAALIFRLLTPTILIFALINPLSWLLFSLGLVGRSLKIACVLSPLVIAGYTVGLRYGPKGVALGYSAILTLWLIPHIMWCVHGTPVSFRDIVRTAIRPLASGIVAAVVASAILMYGQSLRPLYRLALGTAVLSVAYLVMLLFVLKQKPFYMDILNGLRRRPLVKDKVLASA
jgi:PST family polysaccharide transporter